MKFLALPSLPPSLRVKVARDSAAVQVDDVFAHDRHVSVSPRPVCPLLWQKEREKERERERERERLSGTAVQPQRFPFIFTPSPSFRENDIFLPRHAKFIRKEASSLLIRISGRKTRLGPPLSLSRTPGSKVKKLSFQASSHDWQPF